MKCFKETDYVDIEGLEKQTASSNKFNTDFKKEWAPKHQDS